jgi:DegV family protein with EDD domain
MVFPQYFIVATATEGGDAGTREAALRKETGPMRSLSGETLFNTFAAGGNRVIANQGELNEINVFPVPDGDTGTNMAFTFYAILENGRVYDSAGKTMQSIAEQALIGARGNSGIILAQFFGGLSEVIGDEGSVPVSLFAKGVRHAVKSAYAAISRPVEGTMLTVIRDWSEAVASVAHRISDFGHLFEQSLRVAAGSLKRTRGQLEVLEKARVVDAGAAGFVYFLRGALEFMHTGRRPALTPAPPPELEDAHTPAVADEEIPYRYCSEALLAGEGLDLDKIRRTLDGLGDSLIVAGSAYKARIHLHTNRPAEMFAALRPLGEITQQKADDMIRQHEVVYHRKYPIALVTDSACDLPRELIDRYQIHQVPLGLSIGASRYLDKVTITPREFYDLLDDAPEYPTSSQPGAAAFRHLYAFLGQYYESVIAVHLSGHLSGTWSASAAEAARQEGKKISVIDSRQLSGSLGLMVLRAAEEIEAGRSHDEVVAALESWRARADILVSVQTLRYMVRGGRVSPLKGLAARVLNLKPIVSVDREGRSLLYGKAFSSRANRKKILRMVGELHAAGPLRAYAVVHAHAEAGAELFSRELEEMLGFPPRYTMDISPVVGLNAGLGAVSVVTMKE